MIARPPTSNWIEPRWNLKTGSIHCRLVMIRIGIGCHGNRWMNLNGQESNIWRPNRLSSATYITAAEQRYFGSCDRFWQTTDHPMTASDASNEKFTKEHFKRFFLKNQRNLKIERIFFSNVEQSASNHLKSSISKEIESFDWKASKLFIGTSWQVQANGPKFDGWRGKSIKDRHQVSESDGDCSWHSISTQPIQSECHRLLLYLWQQQMCHEDDKERKPSNNNS